MDERGNTYVKVPIVSMKFDDVGQCWVADKDETFEGWQILAREQWKLGVERVHIRRSIPYAEFRIVYQSVIGPEDKFFTKVTTDWRLK